MTCDKCIRKLCALVECKCNCECHDKDLQPNKEVNEE